jgi:hypothetical protein
VAVLKSLLDFGPKNDTVPRYWTAPKETRPTTITTEFASHLATKKTTDTTIFVALADAATQGTDETTRHGYGPDFTKIMLESVTKAAAGEFHDAKHVIDSMQGRGKLTVDQKTAWAEAIGAVTEILPHALQQLETLQSAIFEC